MPSGSNPQGKDMPGSSDRLPTQLRRGNCGAAGVTGSGGNGGDVGAYLSGAPSGNVGLEFDLGQLLVEQSRKGAVHPTPIGRPWTGLRRELSGTRYAGRIDAFASRRDPVGPDRTGQHWAGSCRILPRVRARGPAPEAASSNWLLPARLEFR